MIIYKVTSPSNKVYIGISRHSLIYRRGKHIREAKYGSTFKFHKALRKYGDSMIWEILEMCDNLDKSKELEKYYIKKYDSFKTGYNSTLGGDGQFGNPPMLGKRHSEATKLKMSLTKKGKNKPLGFGKKMSIINSGRVQTKEHVNKCLTIRGCKPFLVFKDSEFIGEYSNQSECGRLLKLNQCLISLCLTAPHKNKSHKGFIFRYRD